MKKFIIQSSPDANGCREFFVMENDPRRPGRGDLQGQFLVKTGKTRENWDIITTCYDVDRNVLIAAGAVSVGRRAVNLSDFPGEPAPCAFILEGWRANVVA